MRTFRYPIFSKRGLLITLPSLFCLAPGCLLPAQDATPPARTEPDQPESVAEPRPHFEWLSFPDPAKFKVLGLHWFAENTPKLWRMPKTRFDTLPPGVKARARIPSGARILLRSSATQLGIRVALSGRSMRSGIDVYLDGSFYRSALSEETNRQVELVLFKDLDPKEREILIYLPSQQEAVVSAIGVDQQAKFGIPEHRFAKPLPVVFYGSSVCQGSGGFKPGMSYEAIACRRLNLDFINLGFGGAGKAEKEVVEMVNSIPASCYVFDLGKSYGMQDGAAFLQMLRTIRKSHPGAPLICMTPITSSVEVYQAAYSGRSEHTRQVMRAAAQELIKAGDTNVFLLEGTDLLGFSEHDGLSRDGVHPTDYGYDLIASKLLPVLKKALDL